MSTPACAPRCRLQNSTRSARVSSAVTCAPRSTTTPQRMQSLASLLHGDRITVRRSEHQMRFLHPKGWSYFDTLRKKLHWNEGVA